jgi:hypothetical protein
VAGPLISPGGRQGGAVDLEGGPRRARGVVRVAHGHRGRSAEDAEAAAAEVDEPGRRPRGAQGVQGQVHGVALGDAAQVQAGAGVEAHLARGGIEVDVGGAHPGQEARALAAAQAAGRSAEMARGAHQRLDRGIEGAGRSVGHVEGVPDNGGKVGGHPGPAGLVQRGELARLPQRHAVVHDLEGGEGGGEGGGGVGRARRPHLRRRPHDEAHLSRGAFGAGPQGEDGEQRGGGHAP